MLGYEHKKEKVVPVRVFYRRILKNILIAVIVIIICLIIGIVGYHYSAGLSWLDSLHNASMILSGMGLVDPVKSDGGKIFSSIYALFSGVVFITNIGIILAPAIHRIIHKLHMEDK